MNLRVMLLVISVVLLAGCNNKQSAAGIGSPVPLSIYTSTEAVSVPTKTSAPTTPWPTIRPTQTIPVGTLIAITTKEAMRVSLIGRYPELDGYNTVCSLDYCIGIEISDNGQWMYFSNGSVMELFNINGQKVGMYSFYEIYGHLIDFYDGNLVSVHWSRDGRYLYLATSFGDGGPEAYFGYKASLARVNLEHGTWKDTGISGVISFSPNEKYIIYSTNKSELRLRNLRSGEESIYFTPEHYLYFGNFVWSPDNKKVVFVATPEEWHASDSRFALLMIDVEKQTMSQLYESLLPFYFPVNWVEADKVQLQRFSDLGYWTLDLSTNTITSNPSE